LKTLKSITVTGNSNTFVSACQERGHKRQDRGARNILLGKAKILTAGSKLSYYACSSDGIWRRKHSYYYFLRSYIMKKGSKELNSSDDEAFFSMDEEDIKELLAFVAAIEKEAEIEKACSPIRQSRPLLTSFEIIGELPPVDRPRSPSVHQKSEEEMQGQVKFRKNSF